jgi:hypothetical protein
MVIVCEACSEFLCVRIIRIFRSTLLTIYVACISFCMMYFFRRCLYLSDYEIICSLTTNYCVEACNSSPHYHDLSLPAQCCKIATYFNFLPDASYSYRVCPHESLDIVGRIQVNRETQYIFVFFQSRPTYCDLHSPETYISLKFLVPQDTCHKSEKNLQGTTFHKAGNPLPVGT